MGFNIWVLLKEAWALLKRPGGCCLHQACFMWMLLAWPQALSSEFCWPVKETSLNMRKLEELPIASFQLCPSSPVLESGPDVVCHLPSSVQSPTWDTFSFFLPLPTSLLCLLSLFSLSFPQLLFILMTLWSVRPCIRAKLPDCLSSPSMFLTSQSILQPVRVTETLSYLESHSVFTAALRERERELSLQSTCGWY